MPVSLSSREASFFPAFSAFSRASSTWSTYPLYSAYLGSDSSSEVAAKSFWSCSPRATAASRVSLRSPSFSFLSSASLFAFLKRSFFFLYFPVSSLASFFDSSISEPTPLASSSFARISLSSFSRSSIISWNPSIESSSGSFYKSSLAAKACLSLSKSSFLAYSPSVFFPSLDKSSPFSLSL